MPRDQADEVLEQVKLEYFELDQTAIPAFGHARLRWKIQAPRGVGVTINTSSIGHEGSKFVSPSVTTVYRLTAHYGGYDLYLGSKTLHVDLEACIAAQAPLRTILDVALRYAVDHTGDLYWLRKRVNHADGTVTYEQTVPEISILPGRVKWHLLLRGGADYAPNPVIDIYGEFSIGVRTTEDHGIVTRTVDAVAVDIKAKIHLGVLGTIEAGIAGTDIRKREESIETKFADGMHRIVREEYAPILVPPSNVVLPDTYEPHSATIRNDDGKPATETEGLLEVLFCPPPAAEVANHPNIG